MGGDAGQGVVGVWGGSKRFARVAKLEVKNTLLDMGVHHFEEGKSDVHYEAQNQSIPDLVTLAYQMGVKQGPWILGVLIVSDPLFLAPVY